MDKFKKKILKILLIVIIVHIVWLALYSLFFQYYIAKEINNKRQNDFTIIKK